MSLPTEKNTWVGTDANGKEVEYGEIHEIMYRDISTGNEYRKERIKHLITLAAGVFALTVTFHKDLFVGGDPGCALIFMFIGWGLLLLSLLTGILHFRAWEDFYLSYRKVGNALWRYFAASSTNKPSVESPIGVFDRTPVAHVRCWDCCQTWFLILGLACTGIYVGLSAYSWLGSTRQPGASSESSKSVSKSTDASRKTNVPVPTAPQ